MKNTYTCPKCQSSEVVMIEGRSMVASSILYLNSRGSKVLMDRYICGVCGFTEEWIQLTERFSRWVDKQREEGKSKSDYV